MVTLQNKFTCFPNTFLRMRRTRREEKNMKDYKSEKREERREGREKMREEKWKGKRDSKTNTGTISCVFNEKLQVEMNHDFKNNSKNPISNVDLIIFNLIHESTSYYNEWLLKSWLIARYACPFWECETVWIGLTFN